MEKKTSSSNLLRGKNDSPFDMDRSSMCKHDQEQKKLEQEMALNNLTMKTSNQKTIMYYKKWYEIKSMIDHH